MDSVRADFVADATISPSRSISYTRITDSVSATLNSFVGVGLFSKAERETLGRYESFGGLNLTAVPVVGDKVTYDGNEWKVTRWTKLGSLYTVYGENKRHSGRPSA